ncbi:MAG: group III truncated hemoglobin [Bacteroidetes bacterium]|nr:group III truncated hemoglobin [Bacteroidota bacterium]
MKQDIINRSDIELLVTTFYNKVKSDAVIGYIFNDIAKVNWEKHLPVMFDFWENALLFTGNYTGNPMEVHQRLNRAHPLTAEHFKCWTKLFTDTVDELFEGDKAILAKQRALSIATAIQVKLIKG